MDKLKTLKGFRDFMPETMAVRSYVEKTLREVFEKYGFFELKTPTLEYLELLTGKYGNEAEKLIYKFKDPGGREVGMKYDLTVPLARVIAQNPNLPLPFKRFQIQPVFRAENTQKGRYREIYQCDIDTVGSASPLSDAEILAVISEGLQKLGFSKFTIRVNSRQVLFDVMKKSGVKDDMYMSAIQSIDKLDKKDKSQVEEELFEKGVDKEIVKNIFNNLSDAKPDKYLFQVMDFATKLGVENLKFDPTLSRGLDYYTGPIFETVVEEPKIGSITGGGRYDKLLNDLGGPDLPACGTSFGLDRLCDVIEELGMKKDIKSGKNTLVTVFAPELLDDSIKAAKILRSKGYNASLFLDSEVQLSKQLRYADRDNFDFVAIVGPDEVKTNSISLKDLKNKTQKKIDLS